MSDRSNITLPEEGTALHQWWLSPMTRERLHGIAMILTTESCPIDPSPLGRAALAEFREWDALDEEPLRGIDIGHGNINELDYRAICWYDANIDPQ